MSGEIVVGQSKALRLLVVGGSGSRSSHDSYAWIIVAPLAVREGGNSNPGVKIMTRSSGAPLVDDNGSPLPLSAF